MRKVFIFLPLIAAGLILISCVTTHAPKASVAELYDSAAMPAAGHGSSDTNPPLLEPSVTGPFAAATPPQSATARPATPPQPARQAPVRDSAAARPASTPSVLPDSPGLIPISRSRKAVRFQLPAPEAPPALPPKPRVGTTRAAPLPPPRTSAGSGAASSASAAARPASPTQPPGGGAAAAGAPGASRGEVTLAPGPSASGAAAATSGAAAQTAAATANTAATPAAGIGPGSSGTAASATASTTGAGDSYGRLREIYARQGDELQIGLDGVGFLFLGFPDRSPLADGMSFKGKEIRTGKTWFTFQAQKLGTYDLDFLRQENTTGKSDKETVRVHVVTEQDFASAVNPKGNADAGPVETGDAVFASRLSNMGAYASAVAELQKGYREGNPALNDQIASLYMRMGSYDAAGKYYSRNIAPPNDYTARAVLGMVSIAVAQKDQKAMMAWLKQFLAIRDPSAEEPLIQAVRMEVSRAEIGLGLDLAGEYAARYPNGKWRDEAAFLMANLLEMDSQFRDIARARDLYRNILASDPESTFAAAARERLSYIDRHFFQVR